MPELVRVTICGVPVVPCVIKGNVSEPGTSVTAGAGAFPWPLRETVCVVGLPPALSLIANVPVVSPVAEGLNAISTVQELCVGNVNAVPAQVPPLTRLKFAVVVIPLTTSGTAPFDVIVTGSGLLCWPRATPPNGRLLGER